MGFRMGIELSDDVSGHGYKWEDMTGEAVTVKLEDSGDEVQGHGYKWENMTGDDVEGHGYKWLRLDIDDTQAHGYKWEDMTGKPVTIRATDSGDEIQGHVRRIQTPSGEDDVSGHGYKW
ncbi:MAG: hypothetical protein H0V97_09435 [Actinobacteria bacterium]|nr:hypothetical protein [Actinomycetota bacterium]